jgi:hypothetical protein
LHTEPDIGMMNCRPIAGRKEQTMGVIFRYWVQNARIGVMVGWSNELQTAIRKCESHAEYAVIIDRNTDRICYRKGENK